MKLLIAIVLMIVTNAALAAATITLQWTPDPQASSQDVIHDPDAAVAGDETVVGSALAPGAASFSFGIANDLPNDRVFVRTHYSIGSPVDSAQLEPVCAVGASQVIVIQSCN